MARRKIEVIFAGDVSNLEKSVGKVKGKLSEFGGGFKETLAGVVGGITAANAAGMAFDFLGSSIRDAADENQSIAVLAKSLANAGIPKKVRDSVEDWITKTQNATGVMDDDLRPAMGKLISAGVPLEKAQSLLNDALDISAARGKPLSTVVEALSKGYNGQVGALGRLGLVTKDTEGKTKSFGQIMDDARKKMGGAADAAANTSAGKLKVLQARFADLKEDLGNKLIPVFNALVSFMLDKVLPGLEKFGRWISDHWPEIRDTIVNTTKQIWQYIEPIWNGIRHEVEGAIKLIRGIIKTVTSLIKGDWSGVWDGIKQTFAGVWDYLSGVVETGVSYIRLQLQGIAAVGSGIWDWITAGVSDAWNWVLRTIGSGVNKAIDILNGLIDLANHIPGVNITKLGHVSWGQVGSYIASGQSSSKGVNGGGHTIKAADGAYFGARPGGYHVNLAEAGLDEAVLRVKRGTIVGRSAPEQGVEVHNHFHGPVIANEAQFARWLADVLVRQKRTGGPLAAAIGA